MSLRTKSIIASNLLAAHVYSKFMPIYIVNEYPKSGGTWIAKMLSEAMSIEFQHAAIVKPKKSIIHGHFINGLNEKKMIIVTRDVRDIVISWYFHCFFENDISNAQFVKNMKLKVPFKNYNNIEQNLPIFIQYIFETPFRPRFTWSEFVDKWIFNTKVTNNRAVVIKYEDMKSDCSNTLLTTIKTLTQGSTNEVKLKEIADKFSFENMSGRKEGNEVRSSFMRKGIVGDWENYFNTESRVLIDKYAGIQLIKLGYEKNSSWIL